MFAGSPPRLAFFSPKLICLNVSRPRRLKETPAHPGSPLPPLPDSLPYLHPLRRPPVFTQTLRARLEVTLLLEVGRWNLGKRLFALVCISQAQPWEPGSSVAACLRSMGDRPHTWLYTFFMRKIINAENSARPLCQFFLLPTQSWCVC